MLARQNRRLIAFPVVYSRPAHLLRAIDEEIEPVVVVLRGGLVAERDCSLSHSSKLANHSRGIVVSNISRTKTKHSICRFIGGRIPCVVGVGESFGKATFKTLTIAFANEGNDFSITILKA